MGIVELAHSWVCLLCVALGCGTKVITGSVEGYSSVQQRRYADITRPVHSLDMSHTTRHHPRNSQLAPPIPEHTQYVLVRWASTLPRLHQKHARASGEFSGGSFVGISDWPLLVASTSVDPHQSVNLASASWRKGQTNTAARNGRHGTPRHHVNDEKAIHQ
jgi:hypothetical protein